MQAQTMKAQGYYDRYSRVQNQMNNKCNFLIERALSSMALPEEDKLFTIVDYGCSEGRNSVATVRKILEALCRRRKRQEVCVIHNDLPDNDFNRVLENVYSESRETYLNIDFAQHSKIHVLASGQSFYNQVVADQSVHVGFSGSSTHWLSNLPEGMVQNHIAQCGASSDEKRRLAEYAHRDWVRFLLKRADEMVEGGRLIINQAGRFYDPCFDDAVLACQAQTAAAKQPAEQGPLFSVQSFFNLLNVILHELADERKIDTADLKTFCFPLYCRSTWEAVWPIHDVSSPVWKLFNIDYVNIERFACPFKNELEESGDVLQYAHELTASVRAWSEPILLKHFKDTVAIADVFKRIQRSLQIDPNIMDFSAVQLFVMLTRTNKPV